MFLNSYRSRIVTDKDDFCASLFFLRFSLTERREQIITISKSNSSAISSCASHIYIQIEWVYVFNMYGIRTFPTAEVRAAKEEENGFRSA